MFYFVILYIFVFCVYSISGECKWPISSLPTPSPSGSGGHPLLITENGQSRQLFHPIGSNIVLTTGDSLLAVCNGLDNFVFYGQTTGVIGRAVEILTCVGGFDVKVDGHTVDIRNVNCVTRVMDQVLNTGTSCGGPGNTGVQLSIIFPTILGKFQSMSVCYDRRRNTAIYSEAIIHGAAINSRYKGSIDKKFRPNGLQGNNAYWNTVYQGKDQKRILHGLIGASQTNLYMNGDNFMNRGHLTARADNIFYYTQRATYFYVNVVPQWLTINAGTWENIESAVRGLAGLFVQDLKEFTGTFGVLQLEDGKGQNIDIVLGNINQQVTVPKYIWKLVCNIHNNCISYVVLNNPMGSEHDVLCSDISTSGLWMNSNPGRGRGACCDPRQLFQNMQMKPPVPISGNKLRCNI